MAICNNCLVHPSINQQTMIISSSVSFTTCQICGKQAACREVSNTHSYNAFVPINEKTEIKKTVEERTEISSNLKYKLIFKKKGSR